MFELKSSSSKCKQNKKTNDVKEVKYCAREDVVVVSACGPTVQRNLNCVLRFLSALVCRKNIVV
jgi:hypothetical protein